MKNLIFKTRENVKFRIFRPLLLKVGDLMGKYSEVGDKPILNNQQFQWSELLENNWSSIRKEF